MCADTPEYKDTLFLPRTEFPMRAGLPTREPEWLARWEKIGVYDRLREKEGRPSFVLHDGPPYANGHLHIGHALNKTIKDMIVRSHQMMGFDSRYVPGWDCHGLPIEWKIEEQYRQKGQDKDDVPVIDFRQECRRFAEGWVDIQREEFKRLGITGNWADPYLTMDFHAERVIAEEFMKFLMNGTLYQGSKPVMWSPVEETALAEAEVEYHDKESHTIWVKFRVASYDLPDVELSDEEASDRDREAVAKATEDAAHDFTGAYVIIWTTTPWTIPSNKAVVFGEDVSYGLYEITGRPEECWARIGDRYILADKMAAQVMSRARLDETMYRRLRNVTPAQLSGMTLTHPLANAEGSGGEWDDLRDFRAADFVSDEEGTGFVHCAPSHGMEEFELYRDLGMLDQVITWNVMDDGSFREDLPFFGGKRILRAKPKNGDWEGDANAAVISKLIEVGGLLARGKIKHSYPHSWRSKAPVIYRNTPQWFAAIDRPIDDGQGTYGDTIRKRALTSIDQLVKFTPQSGRNRLYSMIDSRPDWVLSRQRAWGVPLTCFTKKGALPTDPDFLLRNEAVNARIGEAFEAEGADCWYADGAKERFLANDANPDEYDQVFDVLDVWFDSGSTHAFVLRDRADGTEDGIADVYMEGTDQHRGWFHSSLLQACGTLGRAPYRNVVTHGFTLDEKGNKMSKSLGNTILPEQVVKEYGADILRLWVAQTDYTADQRIGPEILKGTADSYRRLRNTMRFLLGNLADFTDAERVDPADMPELERWVLHRLADLDERVRTGYKGYDFQGVFRAIFEFATVDLSSFYFDVRKDALYCDGADSLRRRSARTVLDLLFHRLTTWLAPILVFTMEDVWLSRFDGKDEDVKAKIGLENLASVHLRDFPKAQPEWKNDALAARWAKIRLSRRVVNLALEVDRREKRIGSSLEAKVTLFLAREFDGLFDGVDAAEVLIVSDVDVIYGGAKLAIDVPAGTEGYEDLLGGRTSAWSPDITTGAFALVETADGEKCQRCWKILPDVGTHAHPGTCQRCNEALG